MLSRSSLYSAVSFDSHTHQKETEHFHLPPNLLPVSLLLILPSAPALPCRAKSLQSRLTLGDPVDCSPPDFSVGGIIQARILEWVGISFSRGSS